MRKLNNKFKWIGLAIFTGALLVGCEEASTLNVDDTKVDGIEQSQEDTLNDSIPTGVQNGDVSQETYLEVLKVIDELPAYGAKNEKYIKQMVNDQSVITTSKFRAEYDSFLNEYDVFVKGINGNPSTTADFELNEHIINIVFNTEAYTDEMRMYLKEIDSHYSDNASGYLNERQVSIEALINSMDKYELFTE